MAASDHGLSRNPNVCASCSSMADGMGDTTLPAAPQYGVDLPLLPADNPRSAAEPNPEVIVVEWASGRLRKHE